MSEGGPPAGLAPPHLPPAGGSWIGPPRSGSGARGAAIGRVPGGPKPSPGQADPTVGYRWIWALLSGCRARSSTIAASRLGRGSSRSAAARSGATGAGPWTSPTSPAGATAGDTSAPSAIAMIARSWAGSSCSKAGPGRRGGPSRRPAASDLGPCGPEASHRVRSDGELIFQSGRFRVAYRDNRLRREFIRPDTPKQNGASGRFFRNLKDECTWQHRFSGFREAKAAIAQGMSFGQ